MKRATVHHEVDGSHALMLSLPVHAQAVTPAARPAAAPPPPNGTGGKIDVTHKFFDDPPASKVALASGTRK